MSEALAFAAAMRETRAIDRTTPFQDGIYVESISRILPTYMGQREADDAVVLGAWLTGGLRISVSPLKRIHSFLTWLPPEGLARVVETAGIAPEGLITVASGTEKRKTAIAAAKQDDTRDDGPFRLPGRTALEKFFNDHVIDVVQNREHYRALGMGNPPATILEGPPGCGKTVSVERLVTFLGWPQFTVEANSIASPYIHETSRKVAQLFRAAMEAAPSVLVIDEMDAFLSERDAGASGQHHVEEVAEFLRLIPEAIKAGVLVIGLTNRIDVIDPAMLRRGRFDHVIRVDFANGGEMLDLLRTLLDKAPVAADVDLDAYARRLAGRPLSDASFLVREGGRLAARARRKEIDAASLDEALASILARGEGAASRRIGFI
jgi:hypothetical protein